MIVLGFGLFRMTVFLCSSILLFRVFSVCVFSFVSFQEETGIRRKDVVVRLQ